MNEQKLANGLAFLTLDVLSSFSDTLFIPDRLKEWRRTGLRNMLKDYISEQTFHDQFPLCCFRVFQSTHEGAEKDYWSPLWHWIDSVFLFGGEDRKAECAWSLILSSGCSSIDGKCSDLSQGVRSKLILIQAKLADERARLSRSLDNVSVSEFSKWDAAVLPQIHLEQDFLQDKIHLICSYNYLARAWPSEGTFQLSELQEIHKWGTGIAKQLGMREGDVPFPGSWDYR